MAPWWHFWDPRSGFWGGVVFGLLLFAVYYFAVYYYLASPPA